MSEENKPNNQKVDYKLFAKEVEKIVSNNLVAMDKKNLFLNKFNPDNVADYLENPQKYEKELRDLSTVLMTISPQYKQIVTYLPSIAKFVPVVIPKIGDFEKVDVEKFKKNYTEVCNELENMSIPHEFQRICGVVAREDVFYGYVHETDNSFYIQQLDSDYCKIGNVIDGNFGFLFNFAFFDKNENVKNLDDKLIEYYPDEFKKKYNTYKKARGNKSKYQWQEIDSQNSICIKFLEDLQFPFPPYASLFDDLSDLTQYKELMKTKTKVGSYKFIGMEIPVSDKGDGADNFLVDPNTVLPFYEMLCEELPEGIGAFMNVTKTVPIDFGTTSTAEKSQVSEALENVYVGSGISKINFGSGANNAGAVKTSNSIDSSILFKLYRQFERWLNRRIKNKYNNQFTVNLIDVTTHNSQEMIDSYLKQAQFGSPVKMYLAALSGISQSNERGMVFLENNILNLSEEWKPLNSSHVQNDSTSDSGRPEVDDGDLSESGDKTRDAGYKD